MTNNNNNLGNEDDALDDDAQKGSGGFEQKDANKLSGNPDNSIEEDSDDN